MKLPDSDAKRFATAQARAALRGMVVHCIENDTGRVTFIATFHALTKQFGDLAEVERWLDHVDGKRDLAA